MADVKVATIRTDVYTKVFNHLQTGTYAISTNNIHPNFNRLQRIQEGYPQVIITAPRVGMDELTMGTDKLYDCPVAIMIEVYHSSSLSAKSLADEITKQILQGLKVLRDDNMKNIKFDPDDHETENFNSIQSNHIYRIQFSCKVRGTAL